MSISQYFQFHPELSAQLETARESFSKQSENLSFTAFVLNQKIVDEEDYLIWAQVQFSLVILNNDYFQLNRPDPAFLSRWKDTYAWTNECLPVVEWDGVLFVACLETPVDFNPSVPVCFALSSPLHLKNWHTKYFSLAAPSLGEIDPMALLKVTPLKSSPNEALNLVLEDSSEPNSENNELVSGLDPTSPSFENSFMSEVNALKPQLIRLNPSEMPVPTAIPIEELVPKISLEKPAPKAKVEGPPITSARPIVAETPISSFTPKAPVSQTSAVTPIKAQARSSTPIQSLIEKVGAFQLPKMISSSKNLTAELKSLCEPLTANFEKYLILSVDENEVEARPLLWSSNFNPGVPNYGISLKTPSMFYIVAH